ncbi:MAG TPA: serine/threonine protein kinase [Desulfobulbus sp.]|nr:serine/threonine protein kinase [Desulfobulbus sp.]
MGSAASMNRLLSGHRHDKFLKSTLADRYLFVSILGSGGTGTVYLADDLLLKRRVAVKTILPTLADNPHIQERIESECRLHAAIGVHPHIVALYDKLTLNGRIFLVMEYVRGELLSEMLERKTFSTSGQGSVTEAITLTKQILKGVDCIHAHGILHRDIKASNILVQQSRGKLSAKLMDFGIARMEQDDEMLTRLTQIDTSGPGTPTYMAPERIDPKRYGETCPATDLYATGIILYQLLSGSPPFTGTISEIFHGHLNVPVDLQKLRKDIPHQLRAVVGRALAKKTDERFQCAEDFLHSLRKISTPMPHGTAPQSRTDELTLPVIESAATDKWDATLLTPEPEQTADPTPQRQIQSHIVLLGAVALTAGVILLVTFFLHHQNVQTSPASITSETPQSITNPQSLVIPTTPVANTSEPATSAPPRAMETLQALRTGKSLDINGSTIKDTANTPLGQEDSGWQVLESSAHRIDKKEP